MQKKWYIGILITLLSLLVVIQQQTVVPNQEISLEFVDGDASTPQAQQTIAIVTKQLQAIGVKNIRVSDHLENGKLTITYYSDADVIAIKKLLSKESHLDLAGIIYDQNDTDDKKPEDKDTKEYSLDIYEIQKDSDDVDFNAKYVLEIKRQPKGDSDYNTYNLIAIIDSDLVTRTSYVAQKFYEQVALAIDHTSYKIPEIRAGPITA